MHSLEDYLDSPDGAGKVLAHAWKLRRLARFYQEIAPPYLSAASRLVNYQSGTVIIHAANSAAAAKLQQLAPTLTDGFSRRGVECNGVNVKVRAGGLPARTKEPMHKPLSAQTFRTLDGLRDSLPDSELRQAVDVLIRRSAAIGLGECKGEEARGREEGEAQGRRAVAQSLLRLGISMETIIAATGFSEEEILALRTDGR
jgi:hypothetical protein